MKRKEPKNELLVEFLHAAASASVPLLELRLTLFLPMMHVSCRFCRLGNQCFAAKEYKEAVEHYTKAIQLDNKNHVYFSNRAASYSGLHNHEQAVQDAKECIRLDPSFIKGYYRLSTAYMDLKDYDMATAAIRQGLAMDAKNAQLNKQLQHIKRLTAAQKQKQQTTNLNNATSLGAHTPLDDATSHELADLRAQHAHTTRAWHTAVANVNLVQREHRMAALTCAELDGVPAETNCYRAIGKAFIYSNKNGVLEWLTNQRNNQDKKLVELNQKKDYLERQLKSQQQSINEITGAQ
jgi:tetratricopeptide (TPR) repeat protein